MRQQINLLSLLVLTGLTIFFASTNAAPTARAASPNQTKTTQPQSIIKNFPPGTKISYTTIDGNDAPVSDFLIVGESGQAILPVVIAQDYMPVIYELRIQMPGQNLQTITMQYDRKRKQYDLMGKGFSAFEDFDFGQRKLKADWAGLIHVRDIESPKDNNQLALLSFYPQDASFLAPDRPIIEIQVLGPQAVGGGPTSANVNSVIPTKCGGPYPLSTCRAGAMRQHSQDTVSNYVNPLQNMTKQFSAVMMQQAQIIGSFFDAQLQLAQQRENQKRMAEARTEFQPGEQLCRFGSFTKSLASSSQYANYTSQALSTMAMNRFSNRANTASAIGPGVDSQSRWDVVMNENCDPTSSNGALSSTCNNDNPDRIHRDINYASTMGNALTLDIQGPEGGYGGEAMQDLVTLGQNLYWPNVYNRIGVSEFDKGTEAAQEARRIVALTNVAYDSFARLAGMKAAYTPAEGAGSGDHMKAMMREFGLSDEDITQTIGENPSYYAKLDVLTNKMFQNPQFYTDLYGSNANNVRTAAAISAINSINLQNYRKSLEKTELMNSLILELLLKEEINQHNIVAGRQRN